MLSSEMEESILTTCTFLRPTLLGLCRHLLMKLGDAGYARKGWRERVNLSSQTNRKAWLNIWNGGIMFYVYEFGEV